MSIAGPPLPLPIQWTQHIRDVYVTASVFEPEGVDVHITDDEISISCSSSDGKRYHTTLKLFEPIVSDKVAQGTSVRGVRLKLPKKTTGSARPNFWPRLTKEKAKLAHVTVDWNTWKDEDDLADQEDDEGQSKAFSEAMGFRMSNGTTISGGGDPEAIAKLQREFAAQIGSASAKANP